MRWNLIKIRNLEWKGGMILKMILDLKMRLLRILRRILNLSLKQVRRVKRILMMDLVKILSQIMTMKFQTSLKKKNLRKIRNQPIKGQVL